MVIGIVIIVTGFAILVGCIAINWIIEWKEDVSRRMDKIQIAIDEIKRKELR